MTEYISISSESDAGDIDFNNGMIPWKLHLLGSSSIKHLHSNHDHKAPAVYLYEESSLKHVSSDKNIDVDDFNENCAVDDDDETRDVGDDDKNSNGDDKEGCNDNEDENDDSEEEYKDEVKAHGTHDYDDGDAEKNTDSNSVETEDEGELLYHLVKVEAEEKFVASHNAGME